MDSSEIVLPSTKPETEWIRGRPLQKVSPKRDHSRVQGELGFLLTAWSRGRGEVGPEWRFRIAAPNGLRRPLVPDLAFVAFERLRGLTHDEMQAPAFAPNVAIEILSAGDDPLDVVSKIELYLHGGSELAIVVDPTLRSMTLHDASGVTRFVANDNVSHVALRDFELPLRPFFAQALDAPA